MLIQRGLVKWDIFPENRSNSPRLLVGEDEAIVLLKQTQQSINLQPSHCYVISTGISQQHNKMNSMVILPTMMLAASIPTMTVPKCPQSSGLEPYWVSTAEGHVKPKQETRVWVCYDEGGWWINESAEDKRIFSPYETCNSNVWEKSDVMETFIAPVNSESDVPSLYYELDVSPTGAAFGTVFSDSLGNTTYCPLATCDSGDLPCSGKSTFPSGWNSSIKITTTGWINTVFIPWSMFADKYRPHNGAPWKLWKANFYRYDYPEIPKDNFTNFELSGWSPTHTPSFHTPSQFGLLKPE